MGIFDFLRPAQKNQPIATINQNLPLPQVMRGQNYLSGIGFKTYLLTFPDDYQTHLKTGKISVVT